MFDNLFSILGPVSSAAILVGVVATFAVFPLHRLGCHRVIARRERGRDQSACSTSRTMRLAIIQRVLAGALALVVLSVGCSESSNEAAKQCEPRAPLGGSFYPHAALPTGTCSNEAVCGLTVGEDCGCGAGPE